MLGAAGRWRLALGLARVTVALLVPLRAAPVYAGPEHPALHWVRSPGAEGCIDPRSLARRVEDITGPAFVAASQADISIEARIESTQQAVFTVSMRLVSSAAADGGERVVTLSAADCRALDASIAFLIATAIDPKLGAVPAELSWTDESETAASAESLRRDLAAQASAPNAASEPVPVPAALAPPSGSSQATRLWQLGLAALGGSGADGRSALGLQLSLARSVTPQLTLAAQLSGESALRSQALQASRSVLTQRIAAAVLACWQLPVARAYALRGCAGPELGAMLAHGDGFESNMTTVVGMAGLLARIDLQRDLAADWLLIAGASLHSVILRPRIYYESANDKLEAFRASPWLLQLALGVVYRL